MLRPVLSLDIHSQVAKMLTLLTTANFFSQKCVLYGKQSQISLVAICYLRDLEHFSEFKMAAATILEVRTFPIVDPGDIQGRVIPIYRGFRGWRVDF